MVLVVLNIDGIAVEDTSNIVNDSALMTTPDRQSGMSRKRPGYERQRRTSWRWRTRIENIQAT